MFLGDTAYESLVITWQQYCYSCYQADVSSETSAFPNKLPEIFDPGTTEFEGLKT